MYNEPPTVWVENFEVFLISRFSWVADNTKIIHVEGGITTCEIFTILNCTKISTRTVYLLALDYKIKIVSTVTAMFASNCRQMCIGMPRTVR